MSFDAQREIIREKCSGLLERGEVDMIIGYTEGGAFGMRIPYIFDDAQGAEALEWDRRCAPNLCKYLLERKNKRVGIVAKPCDARGIENYLIENMLIRENIYIIDTDCGGMVDASGEDLPGCGECKIKKPPAAEIALSTSGDFEYFTQEMKKCILCYSCRQACYGCYCKVCFMDRGLPNWQPSEPGTKAKMVYHLGRTMHLAGRCIECGACERVCASGVNARYLIKEVTGFIGGLENE